MSGEVPKEWTATDIGSLFAVNTPGHWGEDGASDGNILVLRSANFLKSGGLNYETAALRKFDEKKLGQKRLNPGDILLERSGGSPAQPVGRVNRFDAAGNFSASNFLQILRTREGVDDRFAYYLLDSFYAAGGTENLQKATTGIRNLDFKSYLATPVLLPPPDEQRRIAEVLRSVDEAIASANDVGRAGEIVFRRRREELIGEARRASSEITVAAALRKNRGEKLLKLQTDRYADAGRYPIVDQGARFICGFTDEESAVWPYDLPVIVFGDHTRILKFVDFPFVIGADGTQCLNPIEGIQPRYFYYALQSLDLQAEGYARHFKLLKEKTVPVPTLHEQTAIERELAAIEAAVAEAQQARLKLAGLKAALAEQLLSGRVRVPA